MTFVALLLSFSTHVTFTLLASLTAFLAATITLVAFAIDIALYVFVKHEVGKLAGVSANTDTAPGASRLHSRLPGSNADTLRACRVLADVCVVHPAVPRGLHGVLRAQARPHGGRNDVQLLLEGPLPPPQRHEGLSVYHTPKACLPPRCTTRAFS